MSSGIQDVGTKKLFVEDTDGDKPAVVFIHGLGGSTNFYEPLVPALSAHYRLVRFDFDGHGRSPLTGPVTIPDLARDVATLIASLPSKKAHIVAHSMGTLVAQAVAVTQPEAVESLVLLGPVRAQNEAAKTGTRARAATVREKGMSAVADTIAQNATSPAARAANLLVAGMVRELLLAQPAEGYARACEALAAADNPDLTKIKAPVLLLAGSDDKLSTGALLDEMKSALPSVQAKTTPDCGHWTVTEAPVFVARETLEFLNGLAAKR